MSLVVQGIKKSKKKTHGRQKSVYKGEKCFNKSKLFQLIRVTNDSSCVFGIVISIMFISVKLWFINNFISTKVFFNVKKEQQFQKQPPEVFCKKSALKLFSSFTRKHLWWTLLLIKLQALMKFL